MAEAVVGHPSAFGAELDNEPITINRRLAFDTWRAAAVAIHDVIPDMAVSLADTSEGCLSHRGSSKTPQPAC